jgi:hypothetical protein
MSYNLFNYVQCEGVHQAAEVASSGSDWLPLGTAVIALAGSFWVNYKTIHHTKRSELEREERALLLKTSEEIQDCHAEIQRFYTHYFSTLIANAKKEEPHKVIFESISNQSSVKFLSSTFALLHHIQGRLHFISANDAMQSLKDYTNLAANLQRAVFLSFKEEKEISPKELKTIYDQVNEQREKLLEDIRALRK